MKNYESGADPMTLGQKKVSISIILGMCMFFGIVCAAQGHSDPTSHTLLQVVWDIGVVDKKQADIERRLGNDPLSLIELPKVTSWITMGSINPNMSEVAIVVPTWAVADGSGIRNGVNLSVWCDHGGLYLDTLWVLDLKKAEGNAAVEWAFDGEPLVRNIWAQKDNFITPQDNFPHDAFVKRLANAKFLVLKIRGHSGLDQINPKIHPKNIAIVPVSLAGDNTGLLKLIENCSNSLDSSK